MNAEHVNIEFRCGCGAHLFIEVPRGHHYFSELVSLSRSFVESHRVHHLEPKKDPAK